MTSDFDYRGYRIHVFARLYSSTITFHANCYELLGGGEVSPKALSDTAHNNPEECIAILKERIDQYLEALELIESTIEAETYIGE